MRIGQAAKRAGLSTSRIRFYEARGLLPKAQRDANGYRDYPDEVVDTLRLIHEAQELGFSLGEIKAGLAQYGKSHQPKRDILVALTDKLTSLDQHIREVMARRARLVEMIDHIAAECARMESACSSGPARPKALGPRRRPAAAFPPPTPRSPPGA